MASKKQSQRTKGNLRPSSSGRAAELLVGSGGSVPGFLGFSALSGDLGYVPVTGSDEIDTDVDADFRMVMRKLTKKDVTTKIKALQEFELLCKDKAVDEVKTVLQYWPRLYNKLVLDVDRRVRETTQKAFEQLVLKVERGIAPHLKALMGAWLIGQCDTYAPAASSAVSAFTCAFPPSKQPEAIVFCKDEVIAYIMDNLLNQTANTLSDPKTTPVEDMESKYHRVITSSLLALKLFISTIPPGKRAKMEDTYASLLKDNKFWKLLKLPQQTVPGAFYSLLATICEVHPAVARSFASKICPSVLHNLDSTSPAVCSSLWQASLLVVTVVEDCWQHVSLRKAVLPKLWSVLTSGGDGNATVIYPNLLPFLSKLPADVTTKEFYLLFFDHMKTGMVKDKVLMSPSECSAIVTAYVECLQYYIIHGCHGEESEDVASFVEEKLVNTIEISLSDKKGVLYNSSLLPKCSVLINTLLKLTQESEESAIKKKYELIIATFWTEIGRIFETTVENEMASPMLERVATFFLCFKTGNGGRNRKKAGVNIRFQDQTEDSHGMGIEMAECDSTITARTHWMVHQSPPFLTMLSNICLLGFEIAKRKSSPCHMKLVSSLLQSYPRTDIYCEILKKDGTVPSADVPSGVQLCCKILVPWLTELDGTDNSFEEMAKCLLQTVLAIAASEERIHKQKLVSDLCENIKELALFYVFVEKIILSSDQDIKCWARGDAFGLKLTEVISAFCHAYLTEGAVRLPKESGWRLLKLSLTASDKGEAVISPEYLGRIISQVQDSLPLHTSNVANVEQCVSFVCDVTRTLIPAINGLISMASAESLVLDLFTFSVKETSVLSADCSKKLEESWLHGVKAFVKDTGGFMSEGGFFNLAANIVKTSVMFDTHTIAKMSQLYDLCIKVADVICETLSEEACPGQQYGPTAQLFLKSLLTTTELKAVGEWFEWPVLQGDIILNVCPPQQAVDSPGIPSGAIPSAFNLNLLKHDICKDHSELWVNTLRDACYWVSLCTVLKDSERKTWHSEVSKFLTEVDPVIAEFLSREKTNNDLLQSLLEVVIHKSLELGEVWSLTARYVLGHDGYRNQEIISMVGGVDGVSHLSNPVLNTFISIGQKLDESSRRQLTEVMAARIISFEEDDINKFEGGLGCLALLVRLMTSAPDGVVQCVLSELKLWRDHQEQLFLFCSDLDSCDTKSIIFNTEVMSFLRHTVQVRHGLLTEQDWDFILCNVVSWCQTCPQSIDQLRTSFPAQLFVVRLSKLIAALADFMVNTLPSQGENFPANLQTEWQEFFSEGIFSVTFPLFMTLSENVNSSLGYESMMQNLGVAMMYCPSSLLLSHQLPALLVAGDDTNLPDEVQSLLNHLSPLLLSHMSCLQVTAFHLLQKVLPELVKYDDEKAKEDDEDKSRSPPSALMTTLDTSFSVVDHILTSVQIGETMVIEPFIDEYTFTTAYLLCWQLLLGYFKAASSELRAEYATHLQKSRIVSLFLKNIFRLMPENPAKVQRTTPLFGYKPDLTPTIEPTVSWLQHLSCHVCYETMKCLPALVRMWWNDLDKNAASYCNGYISKNISPHLIVSEIEAVHSKDVKYDNMTVKARAGAGEVLATYTVEECSMELVVKLAPNHPVTPVTVECSKRVGVAQSQWRKWMLQLTAFLAHQNGSLVNGLAMWRQNLDKHFSGVEECMICFSVIHGSNYHLPKLQCKTCKKKYHSACLYKWFNTSNNSSCPLCRNLF